MKVKNFQDIISNRISLNEMPQIILGLDNDYLDKYLIQEIEKAYKNDSWYKLSDDIYKSPISKTESIYIQIKDDELIGAIRTKYIKVINISLEVILSKKFDKSQKSFLRNIFPIISKYENKDIVSDKEFTNDSATEWYSFIQNQTGIKKVICWDISKNIQIDCIKNQLFGKNEKFKNKRIILQY